MARSFTPVPDSARALNLPLAEMQPPLDWGGLFGRTAPVAIEIGTGNGFFLAAEAARLGEWNFVGIEREAKFYWKMVKRCARAGLTNVRTTDTDAIELLEDWIPPASVRRIYCLFSDPWPKRRHRERRVFTERTPALLERALEPGGDLVFKTDVPWLFNFTVTIFRERGGWLIEEIGKLPVPDPARGEVITNFERKAREKGGEVWGFRARPNTGL